MPINEAEVPYYVVLIDEHLRYKLNTHRQPLGEPSDELIAFAQKSGLNIAIDTHAWDQFARDNAMSPIERERHCCYILIRGGETDEDKQRLIDL